MREAPPRLAEAILRRVLPREDREFILGDLEQQYRTRSRDKRGALRWYWWQVSHAILTRGRDAVWGESAGHRSVRALDTVVAMQQIAPSGRLLQGLADLLGDVRIGLRTLSRDRNFAGTMVLTLALGIGATTSIFSMIEGVLLRPLPYPDANRIVTVTTGALPRTGVNELPFSSGGYWHFADNQGVFEAFGAYTLPSRGYLLGDGPPEVIGFTRMTVSAFDVLGVTPLLGRLPTRDEEAARSAVALISHSLWVSRFGSDPSVIGRTLEENSPIEIIGVMPPDFDFPTQDVDVWRLPSLDPTRRDTGGIGGGGHSFFAIGKLRAGVAVDEAIVDGERIVAGFDEIGYTATELNGLFDGTVRIEPLVDEVLGGADEPLIIAFGVSLFLLVLTCANVACLFVVRAEGRTRELAVRVALGAGRRRALQHALVESLLLTGAGGALGVLSAFVGNAVLVSIGPTSIPRLDGIGLNATVLLFATCTTVAAGILGGVLPVLQAGSRGSLGRLRSGSIRGTIRARPNRVLGALAVSQAALAVILLVGAGLMIRSFQELRSTNPGFDPSGVLTFNLTVGIGPDRRPDDFYFPLLDRLAAIPRVVSVAGTESLPMTGVVTEVGGTLGPLQIDEFPPSEGQLRENFLVKRTLPGYFATMRIPVLEGREFVQDDYSPNFAGSAFVISEAVKRRYWPNETALGKRLTWGRLNGPVVGVVGDVRHRGLEAPADEIIHSAQIIGRTMMIAMRVDGDPERFVNPVHEVLSDYDPEIPVTRVQTMSGIVTDSFDRTSFTMTLLLLAGLSGLVVCAVGVFGVISHVARQQSTEIGVRLALGAAPAMIRNHVIARAMGLAAIGVAMGLAGAVGLSGVLGTYLFGVGRLDAAALLGASSTLLLVSFTSSLVPAWRAARTAPGIALRRDG